MKSLREVILLTHHFYHRGQPIMDEVIEMYAEDLADLDEHACLAAYMQWRRNPANRAAPLPAQIRELVCPEEFVSVEVQAREIAARIVGAITSHGWNNGRSAQEYIGPVGWNAVQRAGGWMHLCQNTGVNISPTTLQAQLRDVIEGSLKYGGAAIDKAIALGEPQRGQGGLTPLSNIRMLISKNDKDGDNGDGGESA